jgi:hypothetical protein
MAPVGPGVESEAVVAYGHQTLGGAEAGLPVVGDAVEVDDEAPALARGPEEPALEPRPLAREGDRLVGPARMARQRPPHGVEDGCRAPLDRGEAGVNEDGRASRRQAEADDRRERHPSASRAREPHG